MRRWSRRRSFLPRSTLIGLRTDAIVSVRNSRAPIRTTWISKSRATTVHFEARTFVSMMYRSLKHRHFPRRHRRAVHRHRQRRIRRRNRTRRFPLLISILNRTSLKHKSISPVTTPFIAVEWWHRRERPHNGRRRMKNATNCLCNSKRIVIPPMIHRPWQIKPLKWWNSSLPVMMVSDDRLVFPFFMSFSLEFLFHSSTDPLSLNLNQFKPINNGRCFLLNNEEPARKSIWL